MKTSLIAVGAMGLLMAAQVLTTVVLTVVNYLVYRWWVFR